MRLPEDDSADRPFAVYGTDETEPDVMVECKGCGQLWFPVELDKGLCPDCLGGDEGEDEEEF